MDKELGNRYSIIFEYTYGAIQALENGDAGKAERFLKQIIRDLALETLKHTDASIGSPFMNKLVVTLNSPTDMDEEPLKLKKEGDLYHD